MKQGLYELLVNELVSQYLKQNENEIIIDIENIDKEEAAIIIADYLHEVTLQKLLELSPELDDQIEFANNLIEHLDLDADLSTSDLKITPKGKQLFSIQSKKNLIGTEKPIRPLSSVARNSIITGARHEPSLESELNREIASADRIDFLVSFIKWSGLRLLLEELREFTQRGGKLRIITTSYMGATDARAVEELSKLKNTTVKISYDTKRTRLHAKSYIFYRDTGYNVAYIGSSNMSNAALTKGLEWNVKIAEKDSPFVFKQMEAQFDSYWHSADFQIYNSENFEELNFALREERGEYSTEKMPALFTIRPYAFQQQILEALEAEREVHGNYRNLVVAATGTGKTVISAFDYKNYVKKHPQEQNRLLFIAHRQEILKQSLYTFRGVLKDENFGELFVGDYVPTKADHLFMSIQTFNSRDWTEKTDPDYYDFIVVDEFHHASAKSYQKLLNYYQPKILLGLTATPERMDGRDITTYFNHRIAAEIRLPEAINRGLLCPFQYFGVTDPADLSKIHWRQGGYDTNELSNLYTIDQHNASRRLNAIVGAVEKYTTDISDVIGLGFCVSVKHAEFMADSFNSLGIKSVALSGQSPGEARSKAIEDLRAGELRFIFTVDIFNEGVDIPEVNTILLLRPTESVTIFLQQIGRGLRLTEGKDELTVLDFIGQAHKNYSYEDKFTALLGSSRKGVAKEIKEGFISLPRGSSIRLEKIVQQYVLNNIKSSFSTLYGLRDRIASFEQASGMKLTMPRFIDYYHLDPRVLYRSSGKSFSRLTVEAGVWADFQEPVEEAMSKAFFRICDIDSRRWIEFLLDLLNNLDNPQIEQMTAAEKRMLEMFRYTVWTEELESYGYSGIEEALWALHKSPQMLDECRRLLEYNLDHIHFVDKPLYLSKNVPAEIGPECPLDLHCQYTMNQLQIGLGFDMPYNQQAGVYHYKDLKMDLFFVTLNKAEKDFSPETMYQDYAINEKLFHWQSQHRTDVKSPTGQRYINHQAEGSNILLFVREYKKDLYDKTEPYTLLGFVDYVQHKGNRPISFVWRLREKIPAYFLQKSSAVEVS